MKATLFAITLLVIIGALRVNAGQSTEPKVTNFGKKTEDLIRALTTYKDASFEKCVFDFKNTVSDVREARMIESAAANTEAGTLLIYSIMGKDLDQSDLELQISPFEGGYDCKVIKQSKATN